MKTWKPWSNQATGFALLLTGQVTGLVGARPLSLFAKLESDNSWQRSETEPARMIESWFLVERLRNVLYVYDPSQGVVRYIYYDNVCVINWTLQKGNTKLDEILDKTLKQMDNSVVEKVW